MYKQGTLKVTPVGFPRDLLLSYNLSLKDLITSYLILSYDILSYLILSLKVSVLENLAIVIF